MAERFSDLTECPFCGGTQFYTKGRITGKSIYFERFDGEEADNGEMYESTDFITEGKAYCESCHSYLGNRRTNTMGKEAEKALKAGVNNG